jgi:hypothetical protein
MQVIYTPTTEKWKSSLILQDTSALPHNLLIQHSTCRKMEDSVSCESYAKEKLNYMSLESMRLFTLKILLILELIRECPTENDFSVKALYHKSPLLFKVYYIAPSINVNERSLAMGQWCR